MTRRFRSPSLFWTFAGAFLFVLIVGALLQALLVATVVEPLRRSWTRDRIELVGHEAVTGLEALPAGAGRGEIAGLLNRLEPGVPGRRIVLVFRGQEDGLVSSREIAPGLRRDIEGQLGPRPMVRAAEPPPRARPAAPRRLQPRASRAGPPRGPRAGQPRGGPPPGEWQDGPPQGPPPGEWQDGSRQGPPQGEWQDGPPQGPPPGEWQGGPPPGPPPGEWQGGPPQGPPQGERQGGPPRGPPPGDAEPSLPGESQGQAPGEAAPGPPRGEPPGPPPTPRVGGPPRVRLAFRDSVSVAGAAGELAVFELPGPPPLRGPLGAAGLVLYFPLALIIAGGAGLVVFRAQVRRLQALEALATRVAAGDLTVRVGDPSPDEIGRLARQLDHMTGAMAADRRQLQALDEQRRKLMANITHELATPLTSIRGFAETLLDRSIEVSAEEREDYLRRVLAEAERLDALTRDLLELARLEAGSMPLTVATLDAADLCRNTVDRFAPRFASAGLALAWQGPLDRAPIEADGRRLEQVLDNLLANALRYVPAGGCVDVRLDPAPGGYALVVEDDGPGIAPADLPQLFDRFYRADATRAVPGSGLGLAIVREIVQRHGGSVTATNRIPHGARFEVRLPRTAAPGA